MTSGNLRDELVAIPGVADAEVTLVDDDAPAARIWLDGSRDGEEVRGKVEALLGRQIPSAAPVPPGQRRSGLGKGLDTLIPGVDSDPVPSQLKPQAESRAASVTRVAVVESDAAVSVEIEDGAGNRYTADVGATGSIDDAVLVAATAMASVPEGVVFGVNEVDVDGIRVLVVVARHSGQTSAGASPIDFGRPFAVAKAARQALDGLS